MVGHDQDHGGLLLAQGNAQHIDVVHLIIIEVIQSWKKREKMGVLLTCITSKTIFPTKDSEVIRRSPLMPTPQYLGKKKTIHKNTDKLKLHFLLV